MVRPWYWPSGGQPHRTEEFTWIVKNKLAVSWWPDPPVFKRYEKEGIRAIINCSEFDNEKDIPQRFVYHHINVPDFGLPTEKQIKNFLEISDLHSLKNEAIVIHCVAGCGTSKMDTKITSMQLGNLGTARKCKKFGSKISSKTLMQI